MTSENPMTDNTASQPASWWLRVWRNQSLRSILFMLLRIVLFVVMAYLLGKAMRWLMPFESLPPGKAMSVSGTELWLRALRSLVPTVMAYWLLVRFVERRKVTELAPGKFLTHSAVGWLVGTATLVVAAAAMAVAGVYRVQGLNSDVYLTGPLVVLGILPGITEEIVARGILFRQVQAWVAAEVEPARVIVDLILVRLRVTERQRHAIVTDRHSKMQPESHIRPDDSLAAGHDPSVR